MPQVWKTRFVDPRNRPPAPGAMRDIAKAEERAAARAKAEAVKTVESVARERGITAETVEAIKAGIFGVTA